MSGGRCDEASQIGLHVSRMRRVSVEILTLNVLWEILELLGRKTGQPEGADNIQKTSVGSETKVPSCGLRVDSFRETA